MENVKTPSFFLEYNKKNITFDIAQDLIDLTYNDVWHGACDDLELKLTNKHGLWMDDWLPAIGDTLSCKMGYEGGAFIDCGEFTIDDVTLDGDAKSGDFCTIKALSAPNTKEIRSGRTKAYENMLLSEIASEVAGRYNLRLFLDSSVNPFFSRVTQNNETDLGFLKRLAEDYGYAFSVRGGGLFFHAQAKLNEKGYFIIKKRDVSSYQFKTKSTQFYKTIIVPYRLPNSSETSEFSITDDRYAFGDVWRVKEVVETLEQAESMAKNKLAVFNMLAAEGSFSMPGNTNAVAGVNVLPEGFGRFDVKMQIAKSYHKISRQGYTTDLSLNVLGVI